MSESRISNSALIGIFIILGGLAISIFLSSSSLPLLLIYFAYSLIVIMFFIIVWISPILENFWKYMEKRRRNKLAKRYFKEFKRENFVDNFERLHGSEYEYTFHRIIDGLKQDHEEFKSLHELRINLIRDHFIFWSAWYGYFEAKIDYNSFVNLLIDFGSIVRGYHRICIDESQSEISRIAKTKSIQINDARKHDWKTALGYYDDFEKRYNNFLDKVNGEFKAKIIPGRIPPGKDL